MSESRMDGKIGLVLLGLFLSIGLIVSSVFIANAMMRMKQQRLIRVKGTAETQVVSDTAVWRGEWVVRSNDLREGFTQMESRRMLVNDMIKQYGFSPETRIIFHPVRMDPVHQVDEHGHQTSRVETYLFRQSVEIQSREVKRVEQIARQSPELIKHGMEFRSLPASYTYSELEQLKMDLLGRAMHNALERARTMSQSTGTSIGALVSATQGVFQITAPHSTETSDYGSYDTSTVEKTVKAVVSCEFSAQK